MTQTRVTICHSAGMPNVVIAYGSEPEDSCPPRLTNNKVVDPNIREVLCPVDREVQEGEVGEGHHHCIVPCSPFHQFPAESELRPLGRRLVGRWGIPHGAAEGSSQRTTGPEDIPHALRGERASDRRRHEKRAEWARYQRGLGLAADSYAATSCASPDGRILNRVLGRTLFNNDDYRTPVNSGWCSCGSESVSPFVSPAAAS